MLTIGLVVMVIFLFLRTFAATVIPSVAVPLSLVGTFGAMYLLGYSLNNLTLMALTISTGFVVDDAIVMIENIVALHRRRRPAAAGRAQGRGADRVYDHVADHFADRGADPAAVHGRHRGPAVPRVRDHAERDHSDFGGGFADAHADDVRASCCSHKPEAEQGGFIGFRSACFEAIIAVYGRTLQVVLRISRSRCWSRSARWWLTVICYIIIPKGFFPVQDTGVILGVSEAPQTISFPGHGRSATGAGEVILQGSGGGEPVVVYRRRRDQHDR